MNLLSWGQVGMNNKEPDWVCHDCASERGAYIPLTHLPTYHTGICGLCGEVKEVNELRDYGRTRGLLTIGKNSRKTPSSK